MTLSVRAQAAVALARVIRDQKSLSQALPDAGRALSAKDQALLQDLCFGVCRFHERYAFLASQYLRKAFKPKDAELTALLYLGFHQLLESRIPPHAALAATVDASRELGKPWAAKLINAVLRNLQRACESPPDSWQSDPGYRFSHPDWLLQRLRRAWPDQWQAVAEANNAHPPLTLRVNRQRTTVDAYLQRLTECAIAARPTRFSPGGITLDTAVAVQNLPGFDEGDASVQDEAAQLTPLLLDLAPGQRVLDACCAPGGKTCHILEFQPQLAELLALDVDAGRLRRVEENLQRLQLKAKLKAADAAETATWWDGQLFDRILLDAPCSATGVIRRHPDIKLLRRPSDIDKLVALQRRMLDALWPTLKPGGLLLYATCSVLPEENDLGVHAFINATADAHCQPIEASWGTARSCGRQLLPTTGEHDGFFYAVIRKSA